MRVFKNRWFNRFARRQNITNEALQEAVTRADQGLIDADLGGGVMKQRVARPGQGKSGGYRTIIIFKQGDKAFFVYGFAKSTQDNIDKHEEETFKKAAKGLLSLTDDQIKQLLGNNILFEV